MNGVNKLFWTIFSDDLVLFDPSHRSFTGGWVLIICILHSVIQLLVIEKGDQGSRQQQIEYFVSRHFPSISVDIFEFWQ